MVAVTRFLFVAFVFLISSSKAVVFNPSVSDLNFNGYQCKNLLETRGIFIQYGSSPQGLPCQVDLHQKDQVITLLKAHRSAEICEAKASSMATRFRDRGWSCSSSNTGS